MQIKIIILWPNVKSNWCEELSASFLELIFFAKITKVYRHHKYSKLYIFYKHKKEEKTETLYSMACAARFNQNYIEQLFLCAILSNFSFFFVES